MRKYLLGIMLTLLFSCIFIGGKVEAANQVPGQVMGLKQTNAYKTDFTVKWNHVGEADCYYEVWVADTINGIYELYDDTYSNEQSVYQRNEGKTYYVKVRACSTEWDSVKSEYVNTYGEFSTPIEAITTPGNVPEKIVQTKVTTTSITLQWTAVEGATGYSITYYPSKETAAHGKKKDVVGTTATFSGLAKNTKYCFEITPYRKGKEYITYSSIYESLDRVPTLPTKVSGVKIRSAYASDGELSLEWDEKETADGYCYEIYNGKKKVKTGYSVYNFVSGVPVKVNKFFKVRVKAYVLVKGKKVYGKYSDWSYIAQPTQVSIEENEGKKFKIKWKKVSGATNYTVYISEDKDSSIFKKVTTTKSNKCTIKKYGKKSLKYRKWYRIKVVANKKVGKKTYKSYAEEWIYGRLY